MNATGMMRLGCLALSVFLGFVAFAVRIWPSTSLAGVPDRHHSGGNEMDSSCFKTVYLNCRDLPGIGPGWEPGCNTHLCFNNQCPEDVAYTETQETYRNTVTAPVGEPGHSLELQQSLACGKKLLCTCAGKEDGEPCSDGALVTNYEWVLDSWGIGDACFGFGGGPVD